jgi:membrane-associated phospholipid phosphatase
MERLLTTLADRRWPLLALFCGVLGPLSIFSALAEDVWDREGFAWDIPLLRAIHGYATPSRDAIMVVIAQLGGAWGMIPLCALAVFVLLARRRQRDALLVALAYGGALALNGLAKLVFHNARPTLWVSPAPEVGYGFPSGHAMGSMALLAALVILAWPTRWRWPAGIVGGLLVAAIGFSRLYLGVHYPSDVVAAWTAALAWVVGLRLVLAARVRRRWRRHMRLRHCWTQWSRPPDSAVPAGHMQRRWFMTGHTSGQVSHRPRHGASGQTMPCGSRGQAILAFPAPRRLRERELCPAKGPRALVLVENPHAGRRSRSSCPKTARPPTRRRRVNTRSGRRRGPGIGIPPPRETDGCRANQACVAVPRAQARWLGHILTIL